MFSGDTIIEAKLIHELKTQLPILVTLSWMTIEVNFLQE